MRNAAALLVVVALHISVATGPALGAAPPVGSSSSDTLTGTASADALAGRAGDDDLYGAGGQDVLSGGRGKDQLLGGSGGDVLSAGAGTDQVHADDGARDVVSCGPGLDTTFADREDVVADDCEVNGKAILRGGSLATFDVAGERFRAWVKSPTTIWQLRRLAAGQSTANIPIGSIRRGSGRGASNAPYSWHLDPRSTSMADMTIEVCDARPSYVEDHVDEFVDVVRAYCPWSARLVELRNYGGRAEAPPPPGPPVESPDEELAEPGPA